MGSIITIISRPLVLRERRQPKGVVFVLLNDLVGCLPVNLGEYYIIKYVVLCWDVEVCWTEGEREIVSSCWKESFAQNLVFPGIALIQYTMIHSWLECRLYTNIMHMLPQILRNCKYL